MPVGPGPQREGPSPRPGESFVRSQKPPRLPQVGPEEPSPPLVLPVSTVAPEHATGELLHQLSVRLRDVVQLLWVAP